MPNALKSRRLLPLAALVLAVAAPPAAVAGAQATQSRNVSPKAPSPDPRVGLRAGWFDAGEAIWNLRMISTTPPSANFMNASTPGDARLKNSDLAFSGNIVFQGNYSGWQAWDISNPKQPLLRQSYVCPGSQSDVSVYGNLLFVSAEATSGRIDCGVGGVPDTVSPVRARGVRILDISDLAKPKYITTVQTCRGSHTNTLVTDPNDRENVYIYVSGSAAVRSAAELEGCSGLLPEQDPNSALFRIEVIQVPLANPSAARIVTSPRIFADLAPAPRNAARDAASRPAGARTDSAPPPPAARPGRPADRGPTQCHDITVYPAIGLAGGACAGYGLLLDIRDVKNPTRVSFVADSNFSFWHSATFSNDGSKVLFTDEWGGGTAPRCRVTDRPEWGANALFTLENNVMTFRSYYKLPAPQTPQENCVAHNGSLIPIPGRDVMVQGWYQGGISIFDWTDIDNPVEIAYHDRGPMDAKELVSAGSWSVYWYNGLLVNSEIARGLDIFELVPSDFISQNEIDAAKTVRMEWFNPQEQPKFVWPPSFPKARALLDQLERSNGLAAARITSARAELQRAERAGGQARRTALLALAGQLGSDAGGSTDARRVKLLIDAVNELAAAER
jgi:hypothetical protein